MTVLTGIEIKNLIHEGRIVIRSLDPKCEFNPEDQVTEDAIDLRLSPYALRYRDNINEIDTLGISDTSRLFEETVLPKEGYVLRHEGVLFCQTLDVISLPPDLCGRVNARTTYARFGLSVHLTQPKFPTGGSVVFPLQLVNHNHIPIRIYPYAYVIQLQIETTQGPPSEYKGSYQKQFRLSPPRITDRDRAVLSEKYYVQPTRTLAMLLQDMEARSKTKQLQDTGEDKGDRLSQSLRRILRKRVEVVQIIIGILAGVSLNVFASLLTIPDTSYWKMFSTISILVLVFVFLAIEIWLLGWKD